MKLWHHFHGLVIFHSLLLLIHAAFATETVASPPTSSIYPPTPNIRLWNAKAVDRFYAARQGQPLWLNGDQPRPALASLVRTIDNADIHGLNPEDYHLLALRESLDSLKAGALPQAQQSHLEWAATDAFLTLFTHLVTGRVHPAVQQASQISLDALPQLAPLLIEAVNKDQIADRLMPHPTDPAIYKGLQAALTRWRHASVAPSFPAGPSLRPGDHNERIRFLRDSLTAWEHLAIAEPLSLASAPADLEHYDEALAHRVANFQRHMGLDPDAVIGSQTIAALNASQAMRLDQLRANLERQRWPSPSDSNRWIRVNVPDFSLSAIREGQEVWRTKVIVGRQYRPTPLLSGSIDTIVFNPTWEVPRRLIKEDLLPKILTDPGFLEREGMILYQRSVAGRIPLDPATLAQNPSAIPPLSDLGIRQAPGARNALGRIKFLFPNNEQIYLHDTPSQQLFEKSRRMFSSGCIRVQSPMTLAEFLLESQPRWSRERMEQVLREGKTRTIRIKAIPIQFVYWTAWPDAEDGFLHFREDIYESDRALARALEKTPWN